MSVVLLLAAGAAWESAALGLLTGRRDLVVLKRCVDVDDLLATASSGQADTAVVALEAPGLDASAVERLVRDGVRPVGIAPGGARLEPARVRAGRIGVAAVVADTDLSGLATTVTADPEPVPVSHEDEPEPEPLAQRGRVVAVWGPAGAPGRTTVATGLAAALATATRTTLVDVDPMGGSVAQVLGVLDEVSGLLSAARLAGAGMLEERFASVQRALDPRFTVVTGLPRPDRWSEVRAGTVEALLEAAARRGHVVADTGSCLEHDLDGAGRGRHQLTLAALDVADEVVAVGTADPVGLSRLTRGLVELRETCPTTPVRVVVNRMRPTLGWSERDVAEMVTDFVRPRGLHFLPEDRVAADRALVTGRTLLESAPDSPLTRALGELAGHYGPTAARAPARARRRRAALRLRG